MYKKALCTCKVVVLRNKTYCFFDVLVAVAVVVAKAPNWPCEMGRSINLRHWGSVMTNNVALLLGLKYQEVVTKKRAFTTVAVIWILSVICPVSNIYLFIMACFCLVTLIFSYTKIFLTLRHYKIQVPSQASQEPTQAIPLNIARYWERASIVHCAVHCGYKWHW